MSFRTTLDDHRGEKDVQSTRLLFPIYADKIFLRVTKNSRFRKIVGIESVPTCGDEVVATSGNETQFCVSFKSSVFMWISGFCNLWQKTPRKKCREFKSSVLMRGFAFHTTVERFRPQVAKIPYCYRSTIIARNGAPLAAEDSAISLHTAL